MLRSGWMAGAERWPQVKSADWAAFVRFVNGTPVAMARSIMTLSRTLHSFSATLTLSLLAAPGTALAADWYVATDGAYPRTGTSWGSAFDRVEDAIEVCDEGDVIHIGPGEFSISDGQPIDGCSIVGAGSDQTSLRGDWYTAWNGPYPMFETQVGTSEVRALTIHAGQAIRTIFDAHGFSGTRPRLVLEDVRIKGAEIGVEAYDADVTITNTSFLDVDTAVESTGTASIKLVRVHHKGWHAVNAIAGTVEVKNGRFENSDFFIGNASLVFDRNIVTGRGGISSTTGKTARVTNSVFDTSGDEIPLDIEGYGTWTVAHNTIIKPAFQLCAQNAPCPTPPPAIHCKPSSTVAPKVTLQANAVLGFGYGVQNEQSGYVGNEYLGAGRGPLCAIEAVENAFYFLSSRNVTFDYMTGYGNFADKAFSFTSSYAPSGATSLLIDAAAHQPSDTTNLLRDYNGKTRTWPADIGAVEH